MKNRITNLYWFSQKAVAFFALCLMAFAAAGQSWHNVGPGHNDDVYDLIEFNNKLFAGGNFGVSHWDGSTWTTLPDLPWISLPLAFGVYNQSLYASGGSHSGTISYVSRYNGISWVTVGSQFSDQNFTSILQLQPFNGKLIAAGHFTSNGFDPVNNIAAWNGISWDSLGSGLNDHVGFLAEHNGQLFASGNFTASGNDYSVVSIAKWNGVKWSALDTSHSFQTWGPMISFNNSLILGGVFDSIGGVSMKGVASWNGNTFTSMGHSSIKNVSNFWVFNNELYLCGQIYNQTPSGHDDVVLKWNGTGWQQMGGVFNSSIITLHNFNNELYCGGFFTSPGSYIAKFGLATGTFDQVNQLPWQVYPNPADRIITVTGPEKGTIRITDQVGKQVVTGDIGGFQTQVSIEQLPPGVYFLTIQTAKQHTIKKLVIQR